MHGDITRYQQRSQRGLFPENGGVQKHGGRRARNGSRENSEDTKRGRPCAQLSHLLIPAMRQKRAQHLFFVCFVCFVCCCSRCFGFLTPNVWTGWRPGPEQKARWRAAHKSCATQENHRKMLSKSHFLHLLRHFQFSCWFVNPRSLVVFYNQVKSLSSPSWTWKVITAMFLQYRANIQHFQST